MDIHVSEKALWFILLIILALKIIH